MQIEKLLKSSLKLNIQCIIHPSSSCMYVNADGKKRYFCSKCSNKLLKGDK